MDDELRATSLYCACENGYYDIEIVKRFHFYSKDFGHAVNLLIKELKDQKYFIQSIIHDKDSGISQFRQVFWEAMFQFRGVQNQLNKN